MFYAHIDSKSKRVQSVAEHLQNVSTMSKMFGEKVSLQSTSELVGLLHDVGKGTKKFNAYIKYSSANPEDRTLKGTVNHSTAGAKFIYDSYFLNGDPARKFTAQLISLAICSHHGGLIDCLDLKGTDIFAEKMNTKAEIHFDEAISNFNEMNIEMDNIERLFRKSVTEIGNAMTSIRKMDPAAKSGRFSAGMLAKYIFSCVIDADRYDTYTFMEGIETEKVLDRKLLWEELVNILEDKLEKYPKLSKIDLLRAEVSLNCKAFGDSQPGIYQLSVPTGGGKTLSSLRFALTHAEKFNKDRIIYVVPFTTIIDQNARDIRDILERDDVILEHHSNLIIDGEGEKHKLLTERWDSPIILTTMVQFLETLFGGGTQGVRRMHNLANSIIIFDEIQALPIKCINMFNSAMNFLSAICNCTVILCTATQPLLSTTEMPLKLNENSEMISGIHEKFRQFKRVNLLDSRKIGGYSIDLLQSFILDEMRKVNSVLAIFNTKNSAKEIFRKLNEANIELPDEEKFMVFHLSTSMCPANRMMILDKLRGNLGKQRIVCVSTQLIEAGINISFECVVRSLAGLDSIAQAAGRCNRHGERDFGDVHIVNIESENVSKLIDIKEGQECTSRILDDFKANPQLFDYDLLSPEAMEKYYEYYFYGRKGEMNYALSPPNTDKTMYNLLSTNPDGMDAYHGRCKKKPDLMLTHAFKTAGDEFKVIDQNTTALIVPFKKGEELITLLNGKCSISEMKHYLRLAQQFSVNVFENDFRKLEGLGGVVRLKDSPVLTLRKEFYNEELGIIFEAQSMSFCNA